MALQNYGFTLNNIAIYYQHLLVLLYLNLGSSVPVKSVNFLENHLCQLLEVYSVSEETSSNWHKWLPRRTRDFNKTGLPRL